VAMLALTFPKGGPRTATSGPPPWLEFIGRVNRMEPKFFGQPSFVGKIDGAGNAEVYEHAMVLFPAERPTVVVIQATTEYGEEVLGKTSLQTLE
jgi:hypothetical protein